MKLKTYVTILLSFFALMGCNESISSPRLLNEKPDIYPDYAGVTIPINIAPLNFSLRNKTVDKADVVIENSRGGKLHFQSSQIDIPLKEWHTLLEESGNDSLSFTLSIKEEGEWKQFEPFTIYVSEQPIDYAVVYRKIAPGYEVYSNMGIFMRELSSFKETALVENTLVHGMCVNCHAFNQNNPANMSLHFRGSHGATMLQTNKEVRILDTKTDKTLASAVYPYWHPSGKYVAYSTNQTRQSFHVGKEKRVEVIDLASDVMIYDVEKNAFILNDLLKGEESFQTYPVFSANGRKLYFCSAEAKKIPEEFKEIRYNLCSIDFDPENGTLGNRVDTLINAAGINKSITFPRPSYDGKYIMYTLSDYGNFSIWHKEADLWLYDIETGTTRQMNEVNSSDTESFHNWSSNNRWFVFSSRRDDGLFTRLYISHIDEKGNAGKPFLLPQQEPVENTLEDMRSYNVPEFVTAPVIMDSRNLEKQLISAKRQKVDVAE